MRSAQPIITETAPQLPLTLQLSPAVGMDRHDGRGAELERTQVDAPTGAKKREQLAPVKAAKAPTSGGSLERRHRSRKIARRSVGVDTVSGCK
jgi:hypothetical protein